MAEKKRKEYEEWLRAQEMEAYRLEYDCSVKYEEHQSEKKESKSENALITNDPLSNLKKFFIIILHSNAWLNTLCQLTLLYNVNSFLYFQMRR